MPGLKQLQTSLGEVLSLRGTPLTEPEIWAFLCQTTGAILDLINHDLAYEPETGSPGYVISPETLMLRGDGRVEIAESVYGAHRKSRFIAPELASGMVLGELESEKTYVYGLGMTMYEAADYKLSRDQVSPHDEAATNGNALEISRPLDSVLYSMCEENLDRRITLSELMEICHEYGPKHTHKQAYSDFIIRLHRSVYGNPEMETDSEGEDLYRLADDFIRSGRDKSRRHRSHDQLHRLDRNPPRSRSRGSSGSSAADAYRPRSYHEAVGASDRSALQSPYSASAHTLDSRTHRLARFPLGTPARSFQDLRTNAVPCVQTPPTSAGTSALYERLYGRRKRLEVLRNGLLNDDPYTLPDSESNASGQSGNNEYTDRHSLNSAASYNQGVFRPDWNSRYGSDVGLKFQSVARTDSDYSSDMPLPFIDRSRLTNGDVPHLAPTTLQPASDHNFHPTFAELTSDSPAHHAPSNSNKALSKSQHSLHRPESPARLQNSHRPLSQSQPMLDKSSQSGTPLREAPANRQAASRQNAETSRSPSHASSVKSASTPQSPTRTFLGPEFVCQASKPPVQIYLPHVQGLRSGTQLRPARVILLNGQTLDIPCDVTTTLKHVYDAVVNHLSLAEQAFFGLTYICEGEHMFIDLSTKFSKLAGSSWKDPKSGLADRPFMLYFRVKFYVEDISSLKHPLTKHLFYLQIRRDILEERIHCCEDDALDLAGLALQAECGDWSASLGKNYFYIEHYLPQRIIRRVGQSYIKDKLPRLHKDKLGQTQAETNYLQDAQKLNEYGNHFYRIWKSKQERNVPMWVGVGVEGLMVTEKHLESRFHLFRWQWNELQNMSFNRRKFSVLPKPQNKGDKPLKLTFYTENYKKGRYLLQFSTQQHNFQLKNQTRANIAEQMSANSIPEPRSTVVTSNGEHDNHGYSSEEWDEEGKTSSEQTPQPQKREDKIKRMKVDRIEVGFPIRTIPTPTRPPAIATQSSSTPYQDTFDYQTSMDQTHAAPDVAANVADVAAPRDHDDDDYHDYLDEPDRSAYVVDASLKSRDQTLYPSGMENETVSETLRERLDALSLSSSAPERRITLVKLDKDPLLGVGITIVGGENANHLDLGIFVKGITPEGPAEVSNLVQPGDRIIAINGRSLEGISHLRAVEMIRESDSPVHFLLSQPAHPLPGLSEMRSKIPLSTSTSLKSTKTPPSRNSGRSSLEKNGLDIPRLTRYDIDSSASEQTSVHDEGTPSHRVACLPAGAPYDIVLSKADGSLGFNVEGGVNTNSPQGGIYVESMVPLGPAHIDGRMLVGDRLLEVNGVPLSGATHKQAVTALRQAPDPCKLTMEKGQRSNRLDYSFVTPENTYAVQLDKDQHGLGFSVIGGRDETASAEPHDVIPRVKKVFDRGPAHDCGRLEAGDVLLNVNETSVREMTHSDIIALLRGASGPVRLKFCRPRPGILPSFNHLPSSGDATPTRADVMVHETFEKTAASPRTEWRKRPEFQRSQRLPSPGAESPRLTPSPPPSQLVRPMATLTVAPPKNPGSTADDKPSRSVSNVSDMSSVAPEDDQPRFLDVTLFKDENTGGLGFRVDNNPDEPGCHISSIIAEPALSDGRLKSGDKLLTLNTVDVSKYDRSQLSETLELLPERVSMRLLRDPKHELETYAAIADPAKFDLINVNLVKPREGTLGIAISGVEKGTNKRGIFIKTVTPDSPAQKDGRIQVGDRLVQVNGESVLTVKVKQAVAVLKKVSGNVTLIVARPKTKSVSPVNVTPTRAAPVNATPRRSPQPATLSPPRSPRPAPRSRETRSASKSPARTPQHGTPAKSPRHGASSPSRVCPVSPSRVSAKSDSVNADEHEALEYLINSVRPYCDDESKPDPSWQRDPEEPTLRPFRPDDIRMESKWDNMNSPRMDEDDDDLDFEEPEVEVVDRRHLIPSPVTDAWLRSLPLVEPVDSEQYSQSMLPTMIKGLQDFLETDEPFVEYKELRDMDPFDSCDAAKQSENKTLNRYRNVLPYDTCRVKLVQTENDYVNASYVQYRLGDSSHTYIAAQGPLGHTTEDFWLMAWQNNVSVIAMTTQEIENGKSKCHRYWPDNTESTIEVYEKYRVGLTKVESLLHFDVRHLWMEDVHMGVRRQVYQLAYKTWPDHDIPESAVPLMRYLKLVHLYHTTGPILAHCSAGIGRTGVMITVDVAMAHIEAGELFDIFKIVKRIRTQRPGMIQTKDQYIFCYQACLEALYHLNDRRYGS